MTAFPLALTDVAVALGAPPRSPRALSHAGAQ
jgi:hypothetical protein